MSSHVERVTTAVERAEQRRERERTGQLELTPIEALTTITEQATPPSPRGDAPAFPVLQSHEQTGDE